MINIYLALASLFLVAGCASKSTEFAKKQQATMRFYIEGNRGDVSGTGTVLVTRERYPYTIDRDAFLTEADLRKVTMINEPGPNGGYSIELQFNEHGALALEMATTLNKGRHIIIFSQFPPVGYKSPKEPKKTKKQAADDDDDNKLEDLRATIPVSPPELEKPGEPRMAGWLAAVLIRERNTSGIFRFSPDASELETKRIVTGLKNDIAYERYLESR
jgi:hypothetical protein